jgi:hypothetical protein
MKSIAKALVLVTQFVATRASNNTEDDDVQALEEVAFILRTATLMERRALIATATELGLSSWADEMGVYE